MADNRKKGGRTTAKGTQPAAKKPSGAGPRTRATGSGSGSGSGSDTGSGADAGSAPAADAKRASASAGKGATAPAGTANPDAPVINRQMRRGGYEVPDQADAMAKQKSRLRLVLGGGGAITLALVVAGVVLFGISGTWIGLLGAVAGVGVGFAVSAQKTFLAKQYLPAAIAIAAIGVLVNVIAVAKVVDVHLPIFALFGCGLGAFFAYVSGQQMTAPPDPPGPAQVILKRTGSQPLPTPGMGNCVRATPDGRIRVITSASVPEGTDPDSIAMQRDYRKARQAIMLLVKRLESAGVEGGAICVLDWDVPTTRDGDITICSVAGLPKVLGRKVTGAGPRITANRPQFKYRAR